VGERGTKSSLSFDASHPRGFWNKNEMKCLNFEDEEIYVQPPPNSLSSVKVAPSWIS
jgi:hypothetical protein